MKIDLFKKRAWNAADLAEITGFSSRYWTGKAAAGEVPGAIQIAGNGGKWSFDPGRFMAWWKSHEVVPAPAPEIRIEGGNRTHTASSEKLAAMLGLN